jgi:phage host-nuclease inhibitor protein Gam
MLLSSAIRNNTSALAAAQNTYKQNVASVNTYINSVLSSSLPVLNDPPPDWSSFTTAYEAANADALQWVNNVMARLLTVPGDVESYNTTISAALLDAQARAQQLIANPSDQGPLQILNADLDNVLGQLALVITFITSAVESVQKFSDTLPAMASNLQTIATDSSQAANADQNEINQLNSDIAALQADIQSLTAQIIALGVADAAALTLGTVATIAAWPFGALTWLVMGPAVAVATTFIALDSVQIEDDNAKITSDQNQITGLTADVATLQVLTSNYASMVAQTQEIEDNLSAILAAWQQLESDVSTAAADTNQALSDATSQGYQDALNDIDGAISEWNAAYAQAGTLSLDIQVNNAMLQLGMSSDDVQAALAGGQSMNVIQYFNQVGNS